MEFAEKKFKKELLYDPTIPLLGICLKKIKKLNSKDIFPPHMFIAVLFITAKIWTKPKCLSMDEWIKKM